MPKTAAIIQSNYIPWRGYFDLIGLSDEFIIYDNVKYTKNDWRNRNRVKTQSGSIWLTIPIMHRGCGDQAIEEARIAHPSWAVKHWKTISQAYRRAQYFQLYQAELERLYDSSSRVETLSSVNRLWIEFIARTLSIKARISSASEYEVKGSRVERLIDLCTAVGATRYLSGPAARSYLDICAFERSGIEVKFMSYDTYPTYPQLHGAFDPFVSVLDLILNVGPQAPRFMKFTGRWEGSQNEEGFFQGPIQQSGSD
jgi:hypothetical protein